MKQLTIAIAAAGLAAGLQADTFWWDAANTQTRLSDETAAWKVGEQSKDAVYTDLRPTATDGIRVGGSASLVVPADETLSCASLGLEFGGATELTVDGGTVEVSDLTEIGHWGSGYVKLLAGTWTTGRFSMGYRPSVTNWFEVAGGTFTVTGSSETRIGSDAIVTEREAQNLPAVMVVSGGEVNLASSELRLGKGATTATGIVDQRGGTVNVMRLDVGAGANAAGYYNISGGTLNLGEPSSAHAIGDTDGSYGELNITGQAEINFAQAGKNFQVGSQWGGEGVVNQSGGTFSLTKGNLALGSKSTATGTYRMTGGKLGVTCTDKYNGNIYVGDSGSGSFAVTNAEIEAVSLLIGNQAGSSGVFRMEAGSSLNITNVTVGKDGEGCFVCAGGGLSVDTFTIGNYENCGTLTMEGGEIECANDVYLNGGTTVDLKGGVLSTTCFHPYGGNSRGRVVVNCDGGTLKSREGSAYFIQGVTNFVIQAGGLTVDVDNGNASARGNSAFYSGCANDGGLTKTGKDQFYLDADTVAEWNGPTRVLAGDLYFKRTLTMTNAVAIAEAGSISGYVTLAAKDVTAVGTWTNDFIITKYTNGSTTLDRFAVEGGEVTIDQKDYTIGTLALVTTNAVLDLGGKALTVNTFVGDGRFTNGTVKVNGELTFKIGVDGSVEGPTTDGLILDNVKIVLEGVENLPANPAQDYSLVLMDNMSGRINRAASTNPGAKLALAVRKGSLVIEYRSVFSINIR